MPFYPCQSGSFIVKQIIALSIAILVISYSFAQSPGIRSFKMLSNNDGLFSGYISSITQDKKGLMWITTSDGLNKYDGYAFTSYHNDIEDTTSIASNDLTCIHEDAAGRLWIGTRNNGLELFDRESRTFKHFRQQPNGLRSNNILDIKEDKNGLLWIRSIAGIDMLSIKKNPASKTDQYSFTPLIKDPLKEGVENIFIDSRNRVFITTNNSVLEFSFTDTLGGYKLIERFSFTPKEGIFIPEMLEDTVNHSLILNNGNIIRFPDYNFKYPEYLFSYPNENIVWTISKDNVLWLACKDEIILYHLQSGNTDTIVSSSSIHQKILNTPQVLFTDRTGVVWLGSGGYGLLLYDPEVEKFHHILREKNIYQILELTPGKIITNHFETIDLNKRNPVVDTSILAIVRKYLSLQTSTPLTKDNDGNIWFSSTRNIHQYNPSTRQVKSIPIPFNEFGSVPYPVYVDINNNIWMGYKSWFLRYKISSGEFKRYNYPSVKHNIGFDFLNSIYEENGMIWLGTSSGLYCFDTDKETIKHSYLYDPANASSLSNNFILSFCSDIQNPGRYLWIGTKGGGLNKLDKFSGKFERFTVNQGLSNNVIYGILPDYDNNLWLSSNKGLSIFNTTTHGVRNFDVNDGLQGNEFNRYAYARTNSGTLVFGGLNGLNYFNPRDISLLPSPPVALTELRLFNKPITSADPLLKSDINYTKKIELRHEQNMLTLRFSALDFRRYPNIRFRYKMEGFDKDWVYSENINEATYTNLDAGKYRFLVQACYETNNWVGDAEKLIIYIKAPWWQTWWFKILVIVGIVLIAYALYRYRIQQVLKFESLRDRIARDLHDEVGSSISTIAIYSKIIHDQMRDKIFSNETLLKKITEHASEIMESMDDIVWNLNTKNDAFENIINRMREHATQLLEAKGYTLHFYFDERLNQIRLSMEKRRDFYLVYKEALNNIAKYANGKNVWIDLSVSDELVRLSIRDDGGGMDVNSARIKEGNGIANMRYRASMLGGVFSITSKPGTGTTITVEF